ncbi:MetQ/NlpA family ABC transporter substrate-binding protein, partial [Salmonella enterica subsp. enterica]
AAKDGLNIQVVEFSDYIQPNAALAAGDLDANSYQHLPYLEAQMKDRGYERPQKGFLPIHMPKNTGAGIILAGLSTVLGFALIWHMWLPA